MKVVFLAFALVSVLFVVSEPKAQDALACESGPVQREFGSSIWNIYGCSDRKSIVVVPLKAIDDEFGYFFVTPDHKGVAVVGEGWGEDMTFQPVFQQLKQTTAAELEAIVAAAQAVKSTTPTSN